MKISCLALALVFALGSASAEDKKPAKQKEKEKPAAKSDKNAAQKAESSITDWADKHNIWKRSSGSKKAEKK